VGLSYAKIVILSKYCGNKIKAVGTLKIPSMIVDQTIIRSFTHLILYIGKHFLTNMHSIQVGDKMY